MSKSYQINNQSATYYLTFQVVGWVDIFSRQCYRDIILKSFEYCRQKKGLEIFAYVIMTNHIHVVMRSKSNNLSDIIRDLKKHIAKTIFKTIDEVNESRREWLKLIFNYHGKYNTRLNQKQFWTHENHAVELTDHKITAIKVNYIHQNPVRAGWVQRPEDYLYSSARNYAELDSLIEIDKIDIHS